MWQAAPLYCWSGVEYHIWFQYCDCRTVSSIPFSYPITSWVMYSTWCHVHHSRPVNNVEHCICSTTLTSMQYNGHYVAYLLYNQTVNLTALWPCTTELTSPIWRTSWKYLIRTIWKSSTLKTLILRKIHKLALLHYFHVKLCGRREALFWKRVSTTRLSRYSYNSTRSRYWTFCLVSQIHLIQSDASEASLRTYWSSKIIFYQNITDACIIFVFL